jgi:UDP-N-acetylglucosamine--N-acetylmuramyl-(pentapeptide) pyrophosphoryl-undecaprenol N-acetylglucosamine transferase
MGLTGRAQRIVFYAWNGIGSGHLTRLTSIARALRKLSEEKDREADIWIMTTSEATKLAFTENFPTLKFPSIPAPGFSPQAHRELCERLIRQTFDALKPDLLVTDTLPQGFYEELPAVLPSIPKRAFVYRPLLAGYVERFGILQKLEPYDLILVPEREEHAGLYIPQYLQNKVRFLGPVIIRTRDEILTRDEARAALGASPGQKIVYLSCGGGGDKVSESRLHSWLEWLSETDYLLVVGAGPLYRGRPQYGRNVVWTERVPICDCMAAFDVAVCSTGYMSFNELMYFGVPTIFVPLKRDADDQFARAYRAQREGAALVLESPDSESLVNTIANVCERGASMRENARRIYNKNYAADFAIELDNLIDPKAGKMNEESQEKIVIESQPPAPITADAQDVWNMYNLFLRRDPEVRQVIQERVGRSTADILAEMLNSSEFQQRVLPAILTKASSDAFYNGTQSLGELLAWIDARLPLRIELRERLLHARTWTECDEILFTDSELLDKFPSIRNASAAVAQRSDKS